MEICWLGINNGIWHDVVSIEIGDYSEGYVTTKVVTKSIIGYPIKYKETYYISQEDYADRAEKIKEKCYKITEQMKQLLKDGKK